ncbi:hypothetical protein M404DRAFT_999976, partial [Pisolithus tinctorius Marx 270]
MTQMNNLTRMCTIAFRVSTSGYQNTVGTTPDSIKSSNYSLHSSSATEQCDKRSVCRDTI